MLAVYETQTEVAAWDAIAIANPIITGQRGKTNDICDYQMRHIFEVTFLD